ncbi:MAG: Mu transposase C-terminal domain-containing protein [Cyanobacteria bacterium J06623_7]
MEIAVLFCFTDVSIRYDPRDMTEIRVYYQNEFLYRAICSLCS